MAAFLSFASRAICRVFYTRSRKKNVIGKTQGVENNNLVQIYEHLLAIELYLGHCVDKAGWYLTGITRFFVLELSVQAGIDVDGEVWRL